MLKDCINCQTKISFLDFYKQYLINNRFKYTCSKCGAVYKASIASIVVYSIIFVILYGYLILKATFSFSTNVLVLIIYFLIFQPLILKYNIKK